MVQRTGSYILLQRALALKGQLWIGSGGGMAVTVTDWSDRRVANVENETGILGFIVGLIDCLIYFVAVCDLCAVLDSICAIIITIAKFVRTMK